jgi:ABC-2 type transport system permease protein
VITLAVLSIVIVLRANSIGDTPSYDLGGIEGQTLAENAASLGGSRIEVTVQTYDDAEAAEAAVRAGDVDAAVVDDVLIGRSGVPGQLVQLVQAAAVGERIARTLDDYDVPADEQAELADTSPVQVRSLEPVDEDREEDGAYAFIGVLLLYGQLFGYGVWIATGVIEEKASRVVEILLSAIRPRQLMAGKIVGIGFLGFASRRSRSGSRS